VLIIRKIHEQVFTAIAMLLGDGLYHCVIMLLRVAHSLIKEYLEKKESLYLDTDKVDKIPSEDLDTQRRTEYFLKDHIPSWAAFSG